MAEKKPPQPLLRFMAPSVQVTLHEQTFTLCLDGDALCALESKVPSLNTLNLGGLEIFDPDRMNATLLRAALWAAALRHHPEYDTADKAGNPTSDGLEALGSFIDSNNVKDVIAALEQAYLATLSEERRKLVLEMAGRGKDETAAETPATLNPPPAGAAASSDGSSFGASADTTSGSAIARPAASA